MAKLNVNGKDFELDVAGDVPLLWALRDVLGMTGTKFGCGAGLCKIAAAFGADEVLQKPLSASDLATSLAKVLRL